MTAQGGAKRLRDTDLGDRVLIAKTVLNPTAGGLVLGALVAFYLLETRHLGLVAAGLVVLAGGLVGCGMGILTWFLIGRASHGAVSLLTAAGNLPPAPSLSLQESLVMRGRHSEAAHAYRDHLAARPDDDDAKLALAGLLAKHLRDPAGAEQLLREVVDRAASERSEWTAANALIDLHRASGHRGRLMAELARFGERYRGTPAAAAAKRELMALKQESPE